MNNTGVVGFEVPTAVGYNAVTLSGLHGVISQKIVLFNEGVI
jgi:hypothetical protein